MNGPGSRMPSTSFEEVTELLAAWSDGDRSALDKLLPEVAAELHQMAHRYMSRERESHTLQTTALVNEAYLEVDRSEERSLAEPGALFWHCRADHAANSDRSRAQTSGRATRGREDDLSR